MNSMLLYLLGTLVKGITLWLLLLLLERLFRLELGRIGSRRLWWGILLVMVLPLSIILLPLPAPMPQPPMAVETISMPPVMENAPLLRPPVALPDTPMPEIAAAPQERFQFPTLERLAGILVVVYIVITGILLLYRFYQLLRWRHCLRGCAPVFEPRLLALFERTRRLTGTEKLNVTLLDGGGCTDSPACGGIFKPYVLFPVSGAANWRDSEISMLLIHELSHVRRRDYVWNLVLYFTEVFYWFNPVFRVIRRRLAQVWETDCDSAVIKHLGLSSDERGQYARLLMDFAIRAGARYSTPALGAEGNINELKQRIREITMNKKIMHRGLLAAVILILFTGAGLLTPVFGQITSESTPPEVQTGDWNNSDKVTWSLIEENKYEEALKRYQWFFDHILEYRKSYYGVRLSFTLTYWDKLGEQYPPARVAMIKTRDGRVELLKSKLSGPKYAAYLPDDSKRDYRINPPTKDEILRFYQDYNRRTMPIVHDIVSLNRTLGQDDQSLELIKYFDRENPFLAYKSWYYFTDVLLEKQEEELLRKYDENLERDFKVFLKTVASDLERNKLEPGLVELRKKSAAENLKKFQQRARILGKPELIERMEKETMELIGESPAPVEKEIKKLKMTGGYQPTEEELKSWSSFNKITQALIKEKKYDEALKRYQWFFNHILEYRKSYTGVRASYTLDGWFKLGLEYSPAMAALLETRDDKIRFMKSGKAQVHYPAYLPDGTIRDWQKNPPTEEEGWGEFFRCMSGDVTVVADIIAINRTLNQPEESVKFVKYLDKNNPAFVEASWPYLVELLLKEYQHDLVRKYDKRLEPGFNGFLDRLKIDLDLTQRKSDSVEFRITRIIDEMRKYQKRAEIQGQPELAARMEKETRAKIKELLSAQKNQETAKTYTPPELKTGDWKNYRKVTKDLIEEGKYDEALQRYQWGFAHISEYLPPHIYTEFYILQEWAHWAKTYQPAREALIKTRDAKVQLLKSELTGPEYAAYRPEDPTRDYRKNPPSQDEILKFRTEARSFSLPLVREAVYCSRLLKQDGESVELLKYFDREKPFLAYKSWYYFKDALLDERAEDLLRKYDSVQQLELDYTSYCDNEMPVSWGATNTRKYAKVTITDSLKRFQRRAEILKNPELAEKIQQSITKVEGLSEKEIAEIVKTHWEEHEKRIAAMEKDLAEWEEKLVKSGDKPEELKRVREMLKGTRESREKIKKASDLTPVSTLVPGKKYVPPELKTGDWDNYISVTRDLYRAGQYDEALKRHEWGYAHISEYRPTHHLMKVQILSDWEQLTKIYPPAREALAQLRDSKVQLLKSELTGPEYAAYRPADPTRDYRKNPPSPEEIRNSPKFSLSLVGEVVQLNKLLEQNGESVELMRYFDREKPFLAYKSWHYFENVLLNAHAEDLLRKYDSAQQVELDFTSYLDQIPGSIARFGRGGPTEHLKCLQWRAEILKNPELTEKIQQSITKVEGLSKEEVAEITKKYWARLDESFAKDEKNLTEQEEKIKKSGNNPEELKRVRELRKQLRNSYGKNKNETDLTPVNTLVPGKKYVPPELTNGVWDSYTRDTETLISDRKYEEALARCQWVLDNIPAYTEWNSKYKYGFTSLIRYWHILGGVYPKAMQTLLEYRNVRENYIRSSRTGSGQTRDWVKNPPQTREDFEAFYGYDKIAGFYFKQILDMNKALGEDAASIQLFRYLDEHHSKVAEGCEVYIMDLLVENNQVDLVKKYGRDIERQINLWMDHFSRKRFAEAKEFHLLFVWKMSFRDLMDKQIKQAQVMGEPKLAEEISRKKEARLKEIDQWISEWKTAHPNDVPK